MTYSLILKVRAGTHPFELLKTWRCLPGDVADDRDKTTRGKLYVITTSVDQNIYFTTVGSLLINKVNNGVSFGPDRTVKLANVSVKPTPGLF